MSRREINPYRAPEKLPQMVNILVDRRMLSQLIESADVRADQLEGKGEPYADELDPKTAAHIRKCIEHVGGAINYNVNQPIIDIIPATKNPAELVGLIARMKTTEEFGDEQPESSDWEETLNNLIAEARKAVK